MLDQLATDTNVLFKMDTGSVEPEWTYASYSESSKILCSSRSTKISKPASISFLAVVGVNAARRSNSFFSHRNQNDGLDILRGSRRRCVGLLGCGWMHTERSNFQIPKFAVTRLLDLRCRSPHVLRAVPSSSAALETGFAKTTTIVHQSQASRLVLHQSIKGLCILSLEMPVKIRKRSPLKLPGQ